MTRPRLILFTCVTLVAYTVTLYLGLGVSQNETHPALWQPTGFLRQMESIAELGDAPALGILLLGLLPWLGFAIGVLVLRSPATIGVAAVAVVLCALFAFYGLTSALRIWTFFHWRGSLVLGVTGLSVGAALAAPWLTAAWSRLGPAAKALSYGPIFVAAVSLIRNATGTDPTLFFNISPWPAIPVLGLEVGAYSLAGLWLGVAVGLAIVARQGHRTLGFCIGAALPVVWFQTRFDLADTRPLGALLGVSATVMLLAFATRSAEPAAVYGRRAAACAGAAALVALPLVTGGALAEGDYVVTRHVRAQALIDALARHYAEHGAYPDALDELVEAGELDAVPTPRIGFAVYSAVGWLEPARFDYQNLGSSYVLEFVATEWVMCSYNPPWPEDQIDEDEAEEYADEYADEDADRRGAWSCPDGRPELW